MDSEKAKEKAKNLYEEVQGGFNEVISRIRELIKEGSARKLIIKDKEGKVLFQTQLAMGVGGAALIGAMAPVISAIGMFAMFLNDVTILVEKDPDAEDDDFSVDADVIEINEDEEDGEEEETKASDDDSEEEKEEKTVGKKKKKK